MSFKTLIRSSINNTLDGPVIKTLMTTSAGQIAKSVLNNSIVTNSKVINILKEHFDFTPYDIAQIYQESYSYTLAAIIVGLATQEQKLAFLKKITHSALEREFSDKINENYFQPFVNKCEGHNKSIPELRQQLLEQIQELSTQPPIFQAEATPFTDTELAEIINHDSMLAITDLVLEQLQTITTLDAMLADFLRQNELLGNGILFFFRQILHKDSHAEQTLAALQREGLWADIRNIETAQTNLVTVFQQQLDEQKNAVMQAVQAGDFAKANQVTQQLQDLQNSVDEVPQILQTAQNAWQENQAQLIEFSEQFNSWSCLLDTKVERVLTEVSQLSYQLENIHADVVATKDLSEEILDILTTLMQRFDLSTQIRPKDEFTQHNSNSLDLIQEAIAKLKGVNKNSPNYNQLVVMAGSVLSSTGDIEEAENLFLKAKDYAQCDSDKALACFNLFQVRVRRGAYSEALSELQTAINIDPNFALHDIEKYPIESLLGVGGMGCVFLCHDEWRESKVVVKCFWEGKKGRREEVFKEVLIMRNLKRPYVPKTLSYGYVDSIKQERPYFVTEYIEDALDGEAWLNKHGKLSVDAGLDIGLQVAEGLNIAHKADVYHLDLKPANLLLKQVEDKVIIKIIDFGLARVATSLKQQAIVTQARSGKSQLSQMIFGTLDYAPPEQLGKTQYGQPGIKSDVFAFGATLYRLLTNESPRFPHPRKLPDLPELQYLLLDCLEEHPDKRPDIETVIGRLSGLLEEISETSPYEQSLEIKKNKKEEITQQVSEKIFNRIEVIKGDIIRRKVDAIVNATDESFSGGGGVDYAIHQQAGPMLKVECDKLCSCHTGEAKITKGYDLIAQFVIHTVGPIWKGGDKGESEILAKCYSNCLVAAEKHAIKTIAFPAISTGAFGFPVELAAKIAVHEVNNFLRKNDDSIEKVILVCTKRTHKQFQAALDSFKQNTQQPDETVYNNFQDKSVTELFNQNNPNELCDYATVLKRLGEYYEAISYCDKALQINPNYDIAWYNKACYYAIQGQIEQTISNLEKAISFNPQKYKEKAKTDSDFYKVRQDTRFQALLSELTEENKQSTQFFCDKLQDSSEGPKMVVVPAGKFKMGDIQGTGNENEQPVHEVYVESFAIGCYTVTFAEYDKFAEDTERTKPDDMDFGRKKRPVISVSWHDAVAYAAWLSQQTGQQYRLPTEAEWEYAARAGTETDYWWGNEIGINLTNYRDSSSKWNNDITAPVGHFKPNFFGLYDTVGNVWEWTCSEYGEKYIGKEKQCIEKVEKNIKLVCRGGAWYYEANDVRASYRDGKEPSYWSLGGGFRLVRVIAQEEDKKTILQSSENIFNRIEIIKGNIAKQKVDAIVSPTNVDFSDMDSNIKRAAGAGLYQECRMKLGYCSYGEAKITQSHNLSAKFVIHTVGPNWKNGNKGEPEILAKCYSSCLALAEKNSIKTIAFPSNISKKALFFAAEVVSEIAIREISNFLKKHDNFKKVILVCSENSYHYFQQALDSLKPQKETQDKSQKLIAEPAQKKQNEIIKHQVVEEEQTRQAEVTKCLAKAEQKLQNEFAKRKKQREKNLGKYKIFCDSLQDGTEGPEMVIIPAGKFRMGDIQGTGRENERPLLKKSLMNRLLSKKEEYEDYWVSIKSFAMGCYPVTFAEYDKFSEATNRKKPEDNWGRGNQPVILVSWIDAVAYAVWLGQQTGKQYRLPTEAEWEYAARAGTETDYWWGNKIGTNLANCRDSGSKWSGKQIAPVGSFKPNAFGLYDTVGNVWEWTCSAYEEKYNGSEKRCTKNAKKYIMRGGSWGYKPEMARVSFRSAGDKKYVDVGFRLVQVLSGKIKQQKQR
ncbi:SUMF1/EgtB/PvdO family nonheme iron enzyme [Candidatus Halobeggiatoa sp. HSG11]|nr:SUMF1/EgtB/PvdO family nonheme iron enzyme [Candidatus Halobeggiatoa sp. HSG11]